AGSDDVGATKVPNSLTVYTLDDGAAACTASPAPPAPSANTCTYNFNNPPAGTADPASPVLIASYTLNGAHIDSDLLALNAVGAGMPVGAWQEVVHDWIAVGVGCHKREVVVDELLSLSAGSSVSCSYDVAYVGDPRLEHPDVLTLDVTGHTQVTQTASVSGIGLPAVAPKSVTADIYRVAQLTDTVISTDVDNRRGG